MIHKVLFISLFFFCCLIISGQNFNKTDFFEADMALLDKDYEKAQKTYEKLLKSEPDNSNLNFLNGLCLIHLQERKKESLKFLEKAAPFATSDYKYGSTKEVNAPLEVLKYYAIACKLNDNIPKAIEQLNQYKSLVQREPEETEVANRLLESCYTAQRMQKNPVYYSKSDLGSSIISEKSKQYPVVNHDETMLFYCVKGKYNKNNIYFSEKVNDSWSQPVKITIFIGVKSECYPSSVSFDNERVYLTVKVGVSNDIFYTFRKNKKWQKMVKLDKPVNSKDWDSDAFESFDGKYLYFTSDRKGGMGAMDIYCSEKDEKGNWGKPINLGDKVNTKLNDIMPVMSRDDTKLFFKSEGHENIGGYDVFHSTRTGTNEWSTPVNMGFPINTADDDIHYMPSGDGNSAYVAMSDPAYDGNFNLYQIEILKDDPYKKYEISGQIALQDGSSDFTNASIEVISGITYEKIFDVAPDAMSGDFSFEVSNGNYMINFINPDYNIYTHLVDLTSDYPEDNYLIYPLLELTIPLVEEIVVEEPDSAETMEPPEEEYVEIIESVVSEPVEENMYMETAEEEFTEALEPSYPVPEEESMDTETESYEMPVSTVPYDASDRKFTIQLMALVQRIEPDNLYEIEIQEGEDKYYRYVTGKYNTLEEAETAKAEITKGKYRNAFIRYYRLEDYLKKPQNTIEYEESHGNSAYTIQIMALNKEIGIHTFTNLSNVKVSVGNDQIYRYTTGEYATLSSARDNLENVVNSGYKSAFIKEISKIPNY